MVSAVSSILIAVAAGLFFGGLVDPAPALVDAGLLVGALAGAGVIVRFVESGQ